MKKTFEFTEQEAELLRKEQYKYLINDNIDHFLLLVQQIVSERITPEPKAMTEQEITNKEIYELECILEKVRKGGFMYTFAEAINDIENIFKPFMVQSAQITPEPGESGQSAEDVLKSMSFVKRGLDDFYSRGTTLAAMTTYASQVCADKDREIDALNWAARMNRSDFLKAQSELDKANESLTVMLRENAELEKEVKRFNTMRHDSAFVNNVCLSYRHDFGLVAPKERKLIEFECLEWMRAILNNIEFKPK